jgi:translation initiation factor 4E
LTTAGISSPSGAATNAFNLGSGAFAAFGSANKTPKTPGSAFDAMKPAGSGPTPTDKRDKLSRTLSGKAAATADDAAVAPPAGAGSPWPLKYSWVIWYRPPTSKNSDYEKSTKPMCKISTAQQFWKVYSHMRRPSALPTVSDYHFFKDGIRPVWEDEENRRGGKWIIRLKRGVSDRYWEDLLMAMIGDQFAEAAEEVCGTVLSVRSGEDVFSIWTKNDGGRNIKIRYAACLLRLLVLTVTGKPSSGCSRCRRTPTLCGRATTTASRSGRRWITRGRTRRRSRRSVGRPSRRTMEETPGNGPMYTTTTSGLGCWSWPCIMAGIQPLRPLNATTRRCMFSSSMRAVPVAFQPGLQVSDHFAFEDIRIPRPLTIIAE